MDILTTFKNVTELRKHLKLMKTGSTSGPLGITVEHLLYASDKTLEVFLLLTHAAFAKIHAAEAVICEIRPLHKSDEKFRHIALLEISHKLVTATVASRLSRLLNFLLRHNALAGGHPGPRKKKMNNPFYYSLIRQSRVQVLPTRARYNITWDRRRIVNKIR
jgi:hypothetical protein